MNYKGVIIYNPAAGPWEVQGLLKRLAQTLRQESGWTLELVQTAQAGDAIVLAQDATRARCDLVLAAGGDGTVNEVANGLSGSDTILGIVPVGTGNILARQLHMPGVSVVTPTLSVDTLAQTLMRSRIQRVDVGRANGARFVAYGGVGFDAEVIQQMEPRPKHLKRLGIWPYVVASFMIAADFRGAKTRITVEGGKRFNARVIMAIATNIQHYGAFNVARQARMDDGLLDIFIFRGMGFRYTFRHFLRLWSGRHLSDPEIIQIIARRVELQTTPPQSVQVDGEQRGKTPVVFDLEPGTLRLLVPPQAPPTLFSLPPEAYL